MESLTLFQGELSFCLHRLLVFVAYEKCIMSSFLLLSNLFFKYLSYPSHSPLPSHPGKIKVSVLSCILYLYILVKLNICDPSVIGFLNKLTAT